MINSKVSFHILFYCSEVTLITQPLPEAGPYEIKIEGKQSKIITVACIEDGAKASSFNPKLNIKCKFGRQRKN